MADPPRRPRYFDGMMLTTEDLQAEQTYHRQMRYLTNRLCGHGIAEGLEVTLVGRDVQVTPGVAIDPLGRELVLTEPARVGVPSQDTGGPDRWDLVLVWGEDLEGPTPVPDDQVEPARVVERPRLHLLPLGEAPDQAVALARVHRTRTGVEVDTSVRRRRHGCCCD